MRRLIIGCLAALLLGVSPAAAQHGAPRAADAVTRGLELERRSDFEAAARLYGDALAAHPRDLALLLGLDRVLTSLDREKDLVPFARAALDGSADSAVVYSILVRGYVAAGQGDSALAATEQWAALMPGEEGPYRELGTALAVKRDISGARRVYQLGRSRVGRPGALAPELAQLSVMEGDFAGSVAEWLRAIEEVPGYRLSAAVGLAAAPQNERAAILGEIRRSDTPGARQLEASLLARWGDPVQGFDVLARGLGDDRVRAVEALREYLEQVRPIRTAAARRAMGMTLEALAERVPASQVRRLRSDAAQAYADGGDREGARRMLDLLAGDAEAPEAVSAGAATTLVEVLVDEGKLEEAERRLESLGEQVPSEERLRLRRLVAAGYARAGDLDHADSLIVADRSVEGMALAGQIALFRGDLATAVTELRAAGPFAGSRDEATARAALLALLQPIEAESLPALGRAFLTLARGDTAQAAEAFEEVAGDLPAEKGGAELQLLAGRLAAAQGRHSDAERLLGAAAAAPSATTAPAASLELARLLVSVGRRDDAIATLEHLILTWPRSALVPQARRLLDEARGAVPRT